jgi:glucose/arabinose dehydrogenase
VLIMVQWTLRHLVLLGMMLFLAHAGYGAVPAGFSDTLVTGVGSPTALAFTPDGRLLITTQGGTLRVWNGSLLATPALTFPTSSICTSSERGLLGIALDPDFATNRWIYLFYTFKKPNSSCVNRLSRFTFLSGAQQNQVDPASELVLIDNMLSTAGNHNGGDVHIGKDGYLYVSLGDGGCDYASPSQCAGSNDASRDQHVLTGKILRITRDGGIPPSNPFQGAGTARCNVTGSTTAGNKCQETFAWGLRNPFRIAMDPNAAGTRFFINDVGQGAWEEIDEAQAGADYGWNCREGAHTNNTSGPCNPTPSGMVDPIYEYSHNTGCGSITGGAFVPNGLWPGFDSAYLFSDYVCGKVFKLTQSGTWSAADFATGLGSSSAVHLLFGPFGNGQALYYTTYASGGQVRRISYNVSGNNPPNAVAGASPASGSVPLAVTFDATGSSDPDAGDTLTYFWDFGDGTPEVSTTSLTIQHTYTSAGTFTARLRARDNDFAFSPAATVQVQPGNQAPVPSIQSPAAAAEFAVGQQVVLQGSATDPEDGTLSSSSLSWTVLLHHDTHTHPFLGPVTGNGIAFMAPAPEDVAAAENSYLEIRLTATDSGGLPATATRNFQPNRVTLTLETSPSGRTLTLNGTPVTAPFPFTSWEGWTLPIGAPSQPGTGGGTLVFARWTDSRVAASPRQLRTPGTNATYTAEFQVSETSGPVDFYTLSPCRIVDTRGPAGLVGGPALDAGQTRTFPITGFCGVPSTAKAVAVNVTVVTPSTGGNLRIWPADDAGTGVSALNFAPGSIRANHLLLPLGTAGDLDVLCAMPSGTAHLVIDVEGYFE